LGKSRPTVGRDSAAGCGVFLGFADAAGLPRLLAVTGFLVATSGGMLSRTLPVRWRDGSSPVACLLRGFAGCFRAI